MHLLALATLTLTTLTLAQSSPDNGIGSLPVDRHIISQKQASDILTAAVQNASTIVPENVAVVDPSGLLVSFTRMDNAFLGSIDIAQKKARTAVLFNGLTSAMVGVQAQPGQALQEIEETNGGLIAFGGGFPVYDGSYLIGGVGVSGGTVAQDETVAMAGIGGAGFGTTSG